MSFPNERTLDATLLVFMSLCGGFVHKRKIPDPLAGYFRLTDADLGEKTERGRPKWPSSCEFSRERLAKDKYLYRPDENVDGTKVVRGSWILTPAGEKEATRIKPQFGKAGLLELERLAAPIKKENDDPLWDLF